MISGILDSGSHKKTFSKIGLGHVLNIAKCTFVQKNQKKTNDKILRKCQKTGFSGIFPAFSAGKIVFSKIELSHILDIIILRQCAEFYEKISSTASDIQEILFFQRKLAVPTIFRQFRLQK